MSLRMRYLFSFLLFLTSSNITAQTQQNLDWYLSFFEAQAKENTSVLLNESANRFMEAQEINDLAAQAREWKQQGLLHLSQTINYDTAISYFINALALEDSLKLNYERAITYIAIARVYESIGNPRKSYASLVKALPFQERTDDLNLRVYLLNKMGKMLAEDGQLKAALEQYEVVLELQEEINKPSLKAEAFFNIAHVYTLDRRLEEALTLHKRALTLYRSVNDRIREAQSLNDIGELYRLLKNNERALANHVASLEIRQSLNDKRLVAESYNNIALLYLEQGNTERAIANATLALEAGSEAEATNEKRKSYDYLYLAYKKLGDHQRALHYHEAFAGLIDMVQREKEDRDVVEKEVSYEIEKKEEEIKKLEAVRVQREKEIEAQKKFRNVLIAAIGLSIVVAILILVLYLSKRRTNKQLSSINEKVKEQNQQLQNLNATKDKFFSIISHDLKGPLNSLSSFSGLLINHTDKLSKEDIQMLAKDLDKSLKNLFALLENLLEWSRSQTGNIEFTPELFDITSVVAENKALLEAQAQHKKIQLIQSYTQPLQVKAHKHSITTVVRNLLSNAIKFTPEGGNITLDIQPGASTVTVSIRDTGVGMSAEVMEKLFRIDTKHSTKGTADEKGTGLGLILCKDFIEKNGGQIGVKSELNKGSVFHFTLSL